MVRAEMVLIAKWSGAVQAQQRSPGNIFKIKFAIALFTIIEGEKALVALLYVFF